MIFNFDYLILRRVILSGLVVPGRVQSIGVGPGRRGLVGAAQLDARIPRLRVCGHSPSCRKKKL